MGKKKNIQDIKIINSTTPRGILKNIQDTMKVETSTKNIRSMLHRRIMMDMATM